MHQSVRHPPPPPPHLKGTPPPPHDSGEVQVPQLSIPPHPSPAGLQAYPRLPHVAGVQVPPVPQTPACEWEAVGHLGRQEAPRGPLP